MTLEDFLRDYNIPYKTAGEHHHTTTGFVQIDCPWCSPDWGKYRLGLHPKGYANCWTCGPKSVTAALFELTKIEWKKLRGLIDGLDQKWESDEPKREGVLKLPEGVNPKLLPQHVDYLRKRGFNQKKIQRLWKIQGIGRVGDLAWRIFIPVYRKGEMVSWTTRSISDKVKTRYKSAPVVCEKYPLKSVLYGEEYANNTVIVCEGPLDVWKIGPGAVCTFGLAVTKAQMARIGRYPTRVFCFDNEPEAQRRALNLAREVAVLNGRTVVVTLESHKDVGSVDEKELQELRDKYLR